MIWLAVMSDMVSSATLGGAVKTTVDLSPELLLEVQQLARQQSRTMKSVLEEGLRAVISRYRQEQRFRLSDASVGGSGLRPSLRDDSWDELRAATYGSRL